MPHYNLTKLAYEEHPADTVAKGVGASILGAGTGAILAQRGKASKLRDLREKVNDLRTKEHIRINDIVKELESTSKLHAKDVFEADNDLNHAKESFNLAKFKNAPNLEDARQRMEQAQLNSDQWLDRRGRAVKKLEDEIKNIRSGSNKEITNLKDDFNRLYNDRTKRMALRGMGVGLGTYGAYKAYQHYRNKPMSKTASDEGHETPSAITAKGLGSGLIAGGIGNYIGQRLGDKHKLRDMKNLDRDVQLAGDPFQRKIDFNENRIYKVRNNRDYLDTLGPKQRSQKVKELRDEVKRLKATPGKDLNVFFLDTALRGNIHEGRMVALGKRFVRDMTKDFAKENKVLTAEKAKAIQDVTDQFNKKHQDLTSNAKRIGRGIGAGVGLGTYGAYKAYQHFKNKSKDN